MRLFHVIVITLLFFTCRSTSDTANNPEEVLVVVDDTPIFREEFIYSFQKSHQNSDSIDREKIDQYVDLFINYKLKVKAARLAGYDTASSYINELKQYQEKLTGGRNNS